MDSKNAYTSVFLRAAGQQDDNNSIEESKNIWWWNYRCKDSGGLRLTEKGFAFVIENTDIRNYKIDFPKGFKITPQVLIYLDRYIDCPFFINKSGITVFSEKSALELYLFSGDIRKMGMTKALSKRLSQELPT